MSIEDVAAGVRVLRVHIGILPTPYLLHSLQGYGYARKKRASDASERHQPPASARDISRPAATTEGEGERGR